MKHIGNKETKKRNVLFLLLYTAVSAGITAGAVYAVKNPVDTPLIHQYFLPSLCGNTLYQVFRNTFISLALFILTAFFSGVSALGQPLGVAMLIYRGFGIGVSVSTEYISKGVKALPTVAVLILPECTAVIIISVLAVREIIRSSDSLFLHLVTDCQNGKNDFRLYCLKFFVLVALSAVISVIATVLNYAFPNLR